VNSITRNSAQVLSTSIEVFAHSRVRDFEQNDRSGGNHVPGGLRGLLYAQMVLEDPDLARTGSHTLDNFAENVVISTTHTRFHSYLVRRVTFVGNN
jgi:hypothetical protein